MVSRSVLVGRVSEVSGPEVVASSSPTSSVKTEEVGPSSGSTGLTPRRVPSGLE